MENSLLPWKCLEEKSSHSSSHTLSVVHHVEFVDKLKKKQRQKFTQVQFEELQCTTLLNHNKVFVIGNLHLKEGDNQ